MRNRAKCRICGDVVESEHRHDFVVCKGGHIFVDGGQDYQRYRGMKEGVSLEDIILLQDQDK